MSRQALLSSYEVTYTMTKKYCDDEWYAKRNDKMRARS